MHRCLGSACISFLLWVGLASAGCAPPERAEPIEEAREADRIGSFEQPEVLVASASRRLADTISAADIGRDFGVPDARVPYPDTYWPFIQGGTDVRWNPGARDSRSPIEKYMSITDPYDIGNAKAWEYRHHGRGLPGVATWYGHCPGWTGAALMNSPIRHPVFARPSGQGDIAPCREGEYGCVRFEIGDVNALMAEIYLDGPVSFIGAVCNTRPYEIPRDRDGRVVKDGCDGINAGTLLITAATLLKRYQVPFAIDVQKPNTTDQMWNQPTYRYHIYDYHPLTSAQAANLVVRGTTSGPETGYRWNSAARGFVFVDIGLRFVGEDHPHVTLLPGTSSSFELRMAAVIELDAAASDPDASILGGEYLTLPASNANRLTVSPFLWVSRGAGPDNLPPSVGSSHHNPYIRTSLVKQLIALGQQ